MEGLVISCPQCCHSIYVKEKELYLEYGGISEHSCHACGCYFEVSEPKIQLTRYKDRIIVSGNIMSTGNS